MNIVAVAYGNEEQTMVLVTTSDPAVVHVPWPSQIWRHESIEAWLALPGHSIDPWVDPVDHMVLMRSERDRKLGASDWTQLPDVTLTQEEKAAWAAYRQALRDMPQNHPNTDTKAKYLALTWPIQPA